MKVGSLLEYLHNEVLPTQVTNVPFAVQYGIALHEGSTRNKTYSTCPCSSLRHCCVSQIFTARMIREDGHSARIHMYIQTHPLGFNGNSQWFHPPLLGVPSKVPLYPTHAHFMYFSDWRFPRLCIQKMHHSVGLLPKTQRFWKSFHKALTKIKTTPETPESEYIN